MRLKHTVFKSIKSIAHWHPALLVLSIAQAFLTIILPIIWPMVDTGFWMLSFGLFGFWLSSYTLLKLAEHHHTRSKGFKNQLLNLWESIVFLSWIVVFSLLIVWLFKVVFLFSAQP